MVFPFGTVFRIKSILIGSLHGWLFARNGYLVSSSSPCSTTVIHGVDRGLHQNCSLRRAGATTQITWAVGVGKQVGDTYVAPRELGEGIRVNESTN